MDIRHWGAGLRVFFGMTLALPLLAFGVMTWFTLSVVDEFVDVAKKSIVELPAEKGIEIANLLARVHDRSELIAIAVPAFMMIAFGLVYGVSFVRLFSKLTSGCASVFNAAQQLHSLGAGINQSTDKICKGIHENGETLDLSVGALEHLADTLQRAATEVADADQIARATAEGAVRSEDELRIVTAALEELDVQRNKLEEVVSAFDSIAFQTNILAVNAAVEAARAGEQGRGFGIVADAVKSLAQHSTASAKTIAELIRQSSDTAKKAFDAAQSGAHCLSQATSQARRSREIISKITFSTHEMSGSVDRLAQSFNQLDSSAARILSAVEMATAAQDKFGQKSMALIENVDVLNSFLLSSEIEAEVHVDENYSQPLPSPQLNTQQQKAVVAKKPDTKVSEKTVPVKTSTVAPAQSSQQSDLFTRARSKASQHPKEASMRAGRPAQRVRARDVIPFEGESESDSNVQVRYGTTSGF